MPSGDVRDEICVGVCECENEKRVYYVRYNAAKIIRIPRRPPLQSITQYSLEHNKHPSDTRDIPTPNVLVEVGRLTAFISMPSEDVRDVICVCEC